jgi:hypothetical protein
MSYWTTHEVVHRIVKRNILMSEQGSISTLNDLPTWMVDEVRAIARESLVGAVRYLRFYVAMHHSSSAEDFVEDVLLKGQDAATWKIRDCVCFPVERRCATALEVHYLEALDRVEGERWFRITPRPGDHHSAPSRGAVGVLKRDVRYWHTTPDEIGDYPVNPEDIEPVEAVHLESNIRRWIAHRMAWWARDYLEQHPLGLTGGEILGAVPEVDLSRVTADARIAAEALAREAAVYADPAEFPRRAGFLGPDDWYQAPAAPKPE